ncbi:MAG: hypothetical protein JXX28_07660 [Deltaproteobacteria bacterium]|nr:hypothetical protein [Deltaproteobacteria bacterium]
MLSQRPSALALLTLSLLAACNQGEAEPEDSGDDTPYEPGCITVDGQGGYALLSDAISLAAPGATIAICDMFLRESVVVDKDLTLVGESLSGTYWLPPSNEPALRVRGGATVALSTLSLSSTRTGVEIEGGALTLEDVDVVSAGSYAVLATGAAVRLERVHLGATPTGALRQEGGSLEIRDCAVDGAQGFGLSLEAVDAVVADSAISATGYTGDGSTLTDGWGIDAVGGALSLERVTMTDNFLGAVQIVEGSLEMSGCAVEGGLLGLWLEQTDATLTDISVRDYLQYGVVAMASPSVWLEDAVVRTTRGGSLDHTEEHEGSYGVVGVDAGLTLIGGEVGGNNSGGVYVTPRSTSTAELVMEGTLVEDNGRFGVVTFVGTMDLTDVTVRGTEDHDSCVTDAGYTCNMAVAAWQSDLTMTGGVIEDNGMYGLIGLLGSIDATGVTLRRNRDFGLFVQSTAFTLTDALFEDGRSFGMYAYSSYGSLVRPTFRGGNDVAEYAWDNGDGTSTTWRFYYQAVDLYASESVLAIDGGVFEDGEEGIALSSSTLDLTDTRFARYNRQPLYVSGSDGELNAKRVTLEDIGGYPVYCSNATATLDQVDIRRITEMRDRTEYYTDDTLDDTSDSAYSAAAVASYGCDLTLEDVRVEDSWERAVMVQRGKVSADGLIVSNACSQGCDTAAIDMSWAGEPESLWLTDLSVSGSGAAGVFMEGDPGQSGGSAWLERVAVRGDTAPVTGAGIRAVDLHGLALREATVDAVGGDGVALERTEGSIEGLTVIHSGGAALSATNSTLDATGLELSGAGGVVLSGGSLALASSAVEADAGWGMRCEDGALVRSCEAVSATGPAGASTCEGCPAGEAP